MKHKELVADAIRAVGRIHADAWSGASREERKDGLREVADHITGLLSAMNDTDEGGANLFYDLSNMPTIFEDGKAHNIGHEDIFDDCGDCVHVKSPFTGTIWRFYYNIADGVKLVDKEGVIQL